MEVKTAHPFEVNENEKKLTIEDIFEKYGRVHRQTIECIAVCMPYREAKELTPHIDPYDEDAEGFLLKTVDVPGKYIWVPFDYFESNFVKYDTHIDRCWVEKNYPKGSTSLLISSKAMRSINLTQQPKYSFTSSWMQCKTTTSS